MPRLFGNSDFLRTYPCVDSPDGADHHSYLLSCLASAAFTALAVVVGLLFLRETLPSRRASVDDESAEPLLPGSPASPKAPAVEIPRTPWRQLFTADVRRRRQSILTPQLITILTSQGLLALLATSTLAVTPLFASTPVDSGGLGWTSAQIGSILGVRGVALMAVQLLVRQRSLWPF